MAKFWPPPLAKWPAAATFLDIPLYYTYIGHVWYSGEKRELILSRPPWTCDTLNGVAGLGWGYA